MWLFCPKFWFRIENNDPTEIIITNIILVYARTFQTLWICSKFYFTFLVDLCIQFSKQVVRNMTKYWKGFYYDPKDRKTVTKLTDSWRVNYFSWSYFFNDWNNWKQINGKCVMSQIGNTKRNMSKRLEYTIFQLHITLSDINLNTKKYAIRLLSITFY